jgi:hypothetical protein
MKHIKEYKETTRDYDYIKDRLSNVYDIKVTQKQLDSFEKSAKYYDDITNQEYVKAYVKMEMENVQENVACVTQGSTSGMGAVVTPTAGVVPGVPGAAGSGDIGSGWKNTNNRNVRSRDSHLPRSRRSKQIKDKLKNSIKSFSGTKKTPFDVKPDNTVDYTKKNASSNIKSFSAFVAHNEAFVDNNGHLQDFSEGECPYCDGSGWIQCECIEAGFEPKDCDTCEGIAEQQCTDCDGHGYVN